tara:strand:+ start:501 stop:1655 length:1155 start_codon:yes stop_codon:yes gene_type:complete
MKLIIENFRKFLAEEKQKIMLSGGSFKLFSFFRTDMGDDITLGNGRKQSPEQLDKEIKQVYSNPEIFYTATSQMPLHNFNNLALKDGYSIPLAREDVIKAHLTLWFLIWGYVGWDQQPQSDAQIDFIRNCYKNSGEPELKFYTGTAYRGMVVPENWLYEQLFMQDDEADSYMRGNYGDMRNKEALAGKNYLNLYRLIRGEKVIEPQTKSGFWRHYPRGRAESWSRKLKVSSDYVSYGAFGQITKFDLYDDTEEYLTIILVADGTDRNAEKFLDFDPLYKTTIANREANNKEVPAFVKEKEGIDVKKAIIPYRQVKKLFDKAEKKLQEFPEIVDAIKSGKLRPVQFENQSNSLMLKEHRYTELTKVEQDWELIFSQYHSEQKRKN